MKTMRTHLLALSFLSFIFIDSVCFAQNQIPVGPGPRPPAESIPLNGPIVKTQQGQVQGSIHDDVIVFRGIPFAAPPVGDLRWHEPAPASSWQGVKAANEFGADCRSSEDCLYLNIQSPTNVTDKSQLPVMLYIHGGGFAGGSGGIYDGASFAKNGVVLVTINYRLGRAGWFAHPALTRENPDGLLANYGLMDQIAALEWVKDNISQFGGDKNNVSIFGGSAGGISVNYLMLTPQARGLFHRAISLSGFGRLMPTPLHSDDQLPSAEKDGITIAANLGINEEGQGEEKSSDAKTLKALRALSLQQLNSLAASKNTTGRPLPILDGKLISASALEGFAAGHSANVPYMVGGNSDEASLSRRGINAEAILSSLQKDEEKVLALFAADNTDDKSRIVSRIITDQSISEPDRALARARAKHNLPTFVYHFSYVPKSERKDVYGMRHGGETIFVFNTPPKQGFDNEGQALAIAANKYWIEFAKSGDPKNAGGVQWPAFDVKNEAVMEFPHNAKPVVQPHFHSGRLDFIENAISQQ